ncbi:retrovirus-related Pol polyprotein LINE-1 [Elysia marginata]|uniref:Retrovirus-related Pol polyprotein LINE-1 n=1 Tax=Elysia marginata TaxID=1093978 RepID=A0AAV4GPM6_9GAST|nr:retrovirus-related Pol polyprotein LINE-1 [Elysia marginata]
MEMRCYRRLLSISHKEHITNDEVRRRIENAIGPHVDPLTIFRQRKLKWYGHTTRSSGLAKTIVQGTVIGELSEKKSRSDILRSGPTLATNRKQKMTSKHLFGCVLLVYTFSVSCVSGALVDKRGSGEGSAGSEGVVQSYLLAREDAKEELEDFYQDASPGALPDPNTEVMLELVIEL